MGKPDFSSEEMMEYIKANPELIKLNLKYI
jgi:hypothetical protein